ncbi:MAG: type II toxin-antitoxin system VapC family toxin [Nitrospirae bacterium]|nr:type II toxin-antitoxin system VapC family toxin [Magnetococcales bacterium]HAT51274.1 PIN domain nuclease [Alphaproteobacteria bacterium]
MDVSYVLDTNVVLSYLGGEMVGPLPKGEYFVSVITQMELLSYPSLSQSEESAIQDFLHDITVVGLNVDIRDRAIQLRRYHGLKLPDAIIAATALSLEGWLVTNDQKIARIPGMRCQSVTLKNESNPCMGES